MAAYMLILTLMNPLGFNDTYMVDYNMSREDCEEMVADYDIHQNPMISFECKEQEL
jgi:hypothetical protein